MVNERSAVQPIGLELATFGEVLYAFSALRSTSGRKRGRIDHELLPWPNVMPGAAMDFEAHHAPKIPSSPVSRLDLAANKPVPKPRRSASRCQCGHCRSCQENARWERIFREKFASADYYRPQIRIRYASPLSSI